MEPQYNPPTSTPTMIQGPGYSTTPLSKPMVVRVLRVLAVICIFPIAVAAIFIPLGIFAGYNASGRATLEVAVMLLTGLVLLICAGFLVLHIWIYRGMGARTTAVWYVELVLLILAGIFSIIQVLVAGANAASSDYALGAVFGVILRTAVIAALIYFWLKPETKSYFNVR